MALTDNEGIGTLHHLRRYRPAATPKAATTKKAATRIRDSNQLARSSGFYGYRPLLWQVCHTGHCSI
jgi:hypothetical protein